MAYVDGVLTYPDASNVPRSIKVRVNNVAPNDFLVSGMIVDKDGNILGTTAAPFPVSIISDLAGSVTGIDDDDVAVSGTDQLALAIAELHGYNGTKWRRLRYWAGALGVTEQASTGVATTVIVTVNSATANGTQLIAANSLGTRRRVVISQRSATVQVEVMPGNITAATGKGRPLAAVIGAELPYFIAGELRATCASGSTEVAVTEELNAVA